MPAYIFVRASGFLGFGEVFRTCAERKLFRLAGIQQCALKFKAPRFLPRPIFLHAAPPLPRQEVGARDVFYEFSG